MAIPTIAVELGMCNIMDRELLITDLAQLLLKWHPNRAISHMALVLRLRPSSMVSTSHRTSSAAKSWRKCRVMDAGTCPRVIKEMRTF